MGDGVEGERNDFKEMFRYFLRTIFYMLPKSLQTRLLPFVRLYTYRDFWIRRLKANLSAPKSLRRYLSDNTVYWVDPREIIYITKNEFNIYEHKGRIIGGDWDSLETRFEELDFYTSFQERFSKGLPWEVLPFYKRALSDIEKGIPKWSCKNKGDLDKRCQLWDKLFEDIKQNGYMSRTVLQEEQNKKPLLDPEDEISVNIGRDGDLLFNNGRHRLTFAKLCGIEKIPVMITVRHTKWEAFKKEIEMYAQKNKGRVYAPITYIDLQHIPSNYGEDRFEMIRNSIGEGNSTLLDIGAHWGYFCHKFEEEGFNCFAVERDEQHLYFLRKLRRAENRKFTIMSKSIFEFSQEGPIKYDVVLALAIFHHFLKKEDSFLKFKHLLNNLDAKEMYFEPHSYNEPQMKNAFMNFNPEEFVAFIMSNSCLKNHKLIGECDDGRLLYKLWR